MRRRIACGVLAGLLLAGIGPAGTAFAGNLNANEQELMAIARGTFTYNGVTYRAKESYINETYYYLMRDDVDITDEQKEAAIARVYASVQQGVEEGYLYPVSEDAETSQAEQVETSQAAESNTEGNGTSTGATSEGGSSASTEATNTGAEGNAANTGTVNSEQAGSSGTGSESGRNDGDATSMTGAEGTDSEQAETQEENLFNLEAAVSVTALEELATSGLNSDLQDAEASLPELFTRNFDGNWQDLMRNFRYGRMGILGILAFAIILIGRNKLFFHHKKKKKQK